MEKYKILRDVGYLVIEKEKLPRPTNIRFPFSLNGTKSRQGVCIRGRDSGKFRIVINTTKANFVKCEDGKYLDRKGVKYKRIIGIERTYEENIRTLAHEISHLRFWGHTPEHKSYENYLFNKLINELKFRGVEI